MFEDFVQSGEDWFQSTLYLSMTKTSSQRRKGKHVMMPFFQVKEKFGNAIGAQIYQDKKSLECNKGPHDSTTYFMAHPEAPTQEDVWLQILCVLLCVHVFFVLYRMY